MAAFVALSVLVIFAALSAPPGPVASAAPAQQGRGAKAAFEKAAPEKVAPHLVQSTELESYERGYVGPGHVPPPARFYEGLVPRVKGPLVRRVGSGAGRSKHGRPDRPLGFLAGKTIYLSPGHGWTYIPGASRWETQRPNSLGIVEDFSNAEAVSQFLVPYLLNASADVVPVREIDLSPSRVVLDDADYQDHEADGLVEELGEPALFADSTLVGYGRLSGALTGSTNPFGQGGNRLLETAGTATAMFRYTFRVPEAGHYMVYVSYSAYTARASDAHYVVRHGGGEAHFRVDQRHHGFTWVLLGRFWFPAGLDPERGAVELWNDSADVGSNVSADAVRLGGGLGLTDRGGGVSGQLRALENCRYHAQYAGAPPAVCGTSGDDRTDDVGARSRFAAWVNEPGEDSLYFSWHSDAGGGTGSSIWVYWPNAHDYCDGTQATPGSAALADLIIAEIVGDVRAVWDPGWTDRGRRCAWFGELNPTNNGEMPAVLLESAFHDLLEDVEDMREAAFRRIMARAVYQGMVRYFASRDGLTPALLPEPPSAPAARNAGVGLVEVSWEPPPSDSAGGDPPESYRLYQGPNGLAFDEGVDLGAVTAVTLDDLAPGEVRFFQVTAVNQGGESLPSPVVGVMASPSGEAPLLLVDSFDREDAGILWAQDTGTYLGTVDRVVLDRMVDRAAIRRHGPEAAAHGIPFDSAHHLAVEGLDLASYSVVDVIAGRGVSSSRPITTSLRAKLASFVAGGGNLLLSGSHAASQLAAGGAEDSALLVEALRAQGSAGSGGAPVSVTPGEIFDGIPDFTLHKGDPVSAGGGIERGYDVGTPEALEPSPEGVGLAGYSGGAGPAALRSAQGPPGAAVLLGFPLEGVAEPEQREELMGRILDFFGVEPPPSPDSGAAADAGPDATTDASPCQDCPCDKGCGCASARGGGPSGGLGLGLLVVLGLGLLCRRSRGAGRRDPRKAVRPSRRPPGRPCPRQLGRPCPRQPVRPSRELP
jgi:MYXO-CTERM domain-containing protein